MQLVAMDERSGCHTTFRGPHLGLTRRPINLPNNEERSQCIFFCNEPRNHLSRLASFQRKKIHCQSPMENYSDLITPCQLHAFPELPKYKRKLRWGCVETQLQANTLLQRRGNGSLLNPGSCDNSAAATQYFMFTSPSEGSTILKNTCMVELPHLRK